MKQFIKYILGISFLFFGILGLFLPVFQGILFVLIGLLILAPESKLIKELLAKLRKKYPVVFLKLKQMKKRFALFKKKK